MTAAWQPAVQNDLEQSLIDIAQTALTEARGQRATAAAVSISQEQGMSVTVRKGEVETVEHNRDKSFGVTVYLGQRCGHAASTDFSATAIADTVAAAVSIARYTGEDAANGLADPAHLATEFPDLDLYHPQSTTMSAAVDTAVQCETAACDYDPRISNSEGASVTSHDGVALYANSHGFYGFSRGSEHSIDCSVIAGEGAGMQRDYWYDRHRAVGDLASAESIGVCAAERTCRRLEARKIPTGEYPVIYETGVAASLISHLVAAISGGNLYRKASFLLDSRGQTIFPATIQIYEQPHLPRATASAVFDGEGVATRANSIISNGVLENYLLGSYSARKLGLETTGNASGVHNLTIDPTADADLPTLLAMMGRGVLVTELIGFGVNTVTGDYSRGAFGFWVENGEIQHPVEEFTVAGNLRDMYKNILTVGNDQDTRRNIRSGSIWLKSMTVAGV